MASYPVELWFPPNEEIPSSIRLSVASVFIALSIGKWDGQEFDEAEIDAFLTAGKSTDSEGRERDVYRTEHEFHKFVPSEGLEHAIRSIQKILIECVDNKQIVPLSVRRALFGTIDPRETWLSTESVVQWCKEREVALHELFYSYVDREEKIFDAGFEAIHAARFRAENRSDLELDEDALDEEGDEVDWQALYFERFSATPDSLPENISRQERASRWHESKKLGTRERNVLLTIIAALCAEQKIDYSKPSKAAVLVHDLLQRRGFRVSESAIEGHLKKIPDALETRAK